MADQDDFKIKGAASKHAKTVDEAPSSENVDDGEIHEDPAHADDTPPAEEVNQEEFTPAEASIDDKETEVPKSEQPQEENPDPLKLYRWCKCVCDPSQFGRDHYYLQMDTQVSRWEEPSEPYWLWDASRQTIDENGLQYPAATAQVAEETTSSEALDPNYSGYNPKIHGNYDPNADYAQYHEKKREEESGSQTAAYSAFAPIPGTEYAASGAFNRFTGSFQDAEKSTERHNDANKSARQMGAFFDVDAAANAHDGRSLKEERRNEKLTKKQIKELQDKRRAKKEKKRMDFYKS